MKTDRRGRKGRGNGRFHVLEPLPWFRATSKQLAGLWPFGVGTGVPQWGAPVGQHQETGVMVACDPISYFLTGLISNPSMLLMGRPGLGKSTLSARMIIALAAMGIHSLILGDLKPDYVNTIKAIGGQIIRLGRKRGHLNILDHEYAVRLANQVRMVNGEVSFVFDEATRQEMLGDAHNRRKSGVETLLNIQRRSPITERETSILDTALQVLFATFNGPSCPLLTDLISVIEEGAEAMQEAAQSAGSRKEYRKQTANLLTSLRILVKSGGIGELFAQRTTVQMDMDRSVAFDISSIGDNDTELQAAALLVCWNYGFGQVELRQQLADIGVMSRQNYLVVMDELWRALRVGNGMIDRIDAVTRLNRTYGIGLLFITHTLKDMASVASEEDRAKARGFAERCGIIGLFGLPEAEMADLGKVVSLSAAEQQMLIKWNIPGSWDQVSGVRAPSPGEGLCIIKVGGRRGLPVKVKLTSFEKNLHNTDERWEAKATPVPVAV